jgi:ATP-dependent helicase/nuclease subunit A
LRAHRDIPWPGVSEPYVEFHLTVGSKSDGALDRAARAVVVRLAALIEPQRRPPGASEADELDYGDVAILCRSSSSFEAYEDALDEVGLPYVTVAGRGFFDRPEVRDLLNALRAVSDPTDDVALVGLLRSPALGLSDLAIYNLVRSRPQPSEPLWRHLLRGEGPLAGPSEERAARAVDLIARLQTAAGRTPVADLLKAFMDATHYRAALLRAGEPRAVRNVDKLLADAHASELVSVGAFLDYVDGLRESGAREGEARAVAGGAVQIMTVHQAKGLEFPLVVLGDASWSGGGSRHGMLVDQRHGVLLPVKGGEDDEPAALYQLARERQEDQEAAEAKRLLYVAATRAMEELIVSGTLRGIKKDGTPYKLSGWLAELGRPLGLQELDVPHDLEGAACHRLTLGTADTRAGCCVYEPEYPFDARLASVSVQRVDPETNHQPANFPPPLVAPLQPEPGEPAEEPLRRPIPLVVPARGGAGPPPWIVGELAHQALSEWRIPGGRNETSLERWLRARARAAGLVDDDQVARTETRVRRLLMGFTRHQLFAEIDEAHTRLHEVPYSRRQAEKVDSGKLDLLYRNGSQWTIVEFKTDYVAGNRDFQTLLEEEGYLEQIRRYAAAGDTFLGERPRCLLWMLNWQGQSRVFLVRGQGPPEPAT